MIIKLSNTVLMQKYLLLLVKESSPCFIGGQECPRYIIILL
jgi:hypothetical protein